MTEKQRLDQALVERGLCTGRDRAKGIIMAGQVYVNNQKADKPGMNVTPQDEIEVRGDQLAYVSRGGLKLEKAMKEFGLRLDGYTCADIGASTGGFTDCMLQNGAARVYALDVGHDQLAPKLRQDPRVVNLEGINIREVRPEEFPAFDFIGTDVSFLSLTYVFPAATQLLREGGSIIALIKPQFEAGPGALNKHGVVRQPKDHIRSIETVLAAAQLNGLSICGLIPSPVRGGSGNREYLLYLKKGGVSMLPDVSAVVGSAFGAE